MNVHGSDLANLIKFRFILIKNNIVDRFKIKPTELLYVNYSIYTLENSTHIFVYISFILLRPIVKTLQKVV